MMIYELRILDTRTGELSLVHSVYDTEVNALEAADLMGFGRADIQPRRVFNEEDLLKMGGPD